MIAYIKGVGWYQQNEVLQDWRSPLRLKREKRTFPGNFPVLWYGPGLWSSYYGPEDLQRCFRRIKDQEEGTKSG